MKADLEFILIEQDNCWVAYNQDFEVRGHDFNELEKNLRSEILQRCNFSAGSKIKVFMTTDDRLIPVWVRPYQSHYFNRII